MVLLSIKAKHTKKAGREKRQVGYQQDSYYHDNKKYHNGSEDLDKRLIEPERRNDLSDTGYLPLDCLKFFKWSCTSS